MVSILKRGECKVRLMGASGTVSTHGMDLQDLKETMNCKCPLGKRSTKWSRELKKVHKGSRRTT